jgi:hypothetical protein
MLYLLFEFSVQRSWYWKLGRKPAVVYSGVLGDRYPVYGV